MSPARAGRLTRQAIVDVLDRLGAKGSICLCGGSGSHTAGHVEWLGPDKQRCVVMWRAPREWGEIIYKWVRSRLDAGGWLPCRQSCIGVAGSVLTLRQVQQTSSFNTVLTFFELREGETGERTGLPCAIAAADSCVVLSRHSHFASRVPPAGRGRVPQGPACTAGREAGTGHCRRCAGRLGGRRKVLLRQTRVVSSAFCHTNQRDGG